MAVYEKDLFISYAHIDNQPLKEDLSGWISRFHASLEALLSMRMGKSVNIWRDDKLQGNDHFADEIVSQFSKTAALVSVLSPRYLNSEWCAREVNAFCEHADRSGGLLVKNKARIFKVLKSPVDSEEPLPSIMQELLGYEFYKTEDGVPVEMDEFYGKQYGQDFNRMLNKLAFEIAVLLSELGEESNTGSEHSNKPVIYLAECSFDLKKYREVLEAELRRLGYRVLPDRQLPRTESNYLESVDALVGQCQLSLHLIGSKYGVVPDGPSDKSTADLQNDVAAKHSESRGLRRVVWIAEHGLSEQMRQRNFIESLQSDPEAQKGAELIEGSFEDFRSAAESAISLIEREHAEAESGSPDSDEEVVNTQPQHAIYLICTEEDRKATVALRKQCRDSGLNVSLPAFKGDAAEVRAINEHQLANADTILVFYGMGDEAWKRSIDSEIRKLPGYRSNNKPFQTYTYLAAPSSCDKQDMIDMDEPNLIDAMSGFDQSQVDNLLQSIGTEAVVV
ncbi:MAG: TIR domain-containing protein [Granulosicoccus sp.]